VVARDVTLRSRVNRAAPVDARRPKPYVERPYGLTLDGVDVRVDADTTTTGYAVAVAGRPNSRFRDLSVRVSGGSVSGILVSESDDTHIVDADVRISPPGAGTSPSGSNAGTPSRNSASGGEPGRTNSDSTPVVGVGFRRSNGVVIDGSTFDVPGPSTRILDGSGG
ncbi:MAG: hypothetical protein ABEJ28_02605, partial [Salinigranum sp.]